MGILDSRDYYKPFEYPWAYEAFMTQNKMAWIPEEVPLHEDLKDWNTKLTDAEKNLLTQLFRFFTQADIDIAAGYIEKFMPNFKKPELRMMMASFANMEGIHIAAYSLLLDTIGMPETEYQAFHEYKEMADKHKYFDRFDLKYKREAIKTLAVYSAFGEGLQLFSSFAILLNFQRFNKMKGMGQIITWSVRDEGLHVESMIRLTNTFIEENPGIWDKELKQELYEIAREMVKLEDAFIDLAFEQGGVEGLDKSDVKQYIRFICDKRLNQLNLGKEYHVSNPLTWLDWVLNAHEHANFFETRSTEYSKGTLIGDWSKVWK